MNHIYQATKHSNTTRTTKTTSTWVSPLPQRLYSYNWDNANSGVFIFKLHNKLTNFLQFIHHQFVHFIHPKKPVCGLMNNFVNFIYLSVNLLLHVVGKKPICGKGSQITISLVNVWNTISMLPIQIKTSVGSGFSVVFTW